MKTKKKPRSNRVASDAGLGCNTSGLGCCAREAEEFELVLGRTCDKCSMVRTESDDTIYVCDPRSEKVSDGMTCDAFDAT